MSDLKATPTRQAKVLLVDDKPANLLALETMLAGLEYDLVKVTSGERALRTLLGSDVAVVVLDVQMPGLDGFETARLIRTRERSRHTPIIFLTAFDFNRLSVEEAYALGAVDYLIKPLVPVVLRSKVTVFVELFLKSERLREMEHREFEQRLAEEHARLREQHLREQTEVLRQEDRRKDEFLATLAHELRGPLAPIRNATQVLRLKGQADRDIATVAELLDRQTKHLSRLIDDLLDVSRVRQGKVKLTKSKVELGLLVAQAVEVCSPLIESRRHQVAITLLPEPLWLEADPTRLTQVLANLLTNAAKYTPESGHIGLTAEREGDKAVLRLKDDGIGIRPEMLPRIFDLFAQSEQALQHSQGGLGIGLTLVKNLVEMHGGTVTARSDGPGRGSEFVVRLPAVG
jgi:signal transduction histidine kinase